MQYPDPHPYIYIYIDGIIRDDMAEKTGSKRLPFPKNKTYLNSCLLWVLRAGLGFWPGIDPFPQRQNQLIPVVSRIISMWFYVVLQRECCVYVYLYTYIHTVYIYIYAHTHAHYVYTYVYIYIYVYIYMHTHYVYTYVYIYIHIQSTTSVYRWETSWQWVRIGGVPCSDNPMFADHHGAKILNTTKASVWILVLRCFNLCT